MSRARDEKIAVKIGSTVVAGLITSTLFALGRALVLHHGISAQGTAGPGVTAGGGAYAWSSLGAKNLMYIAAAVAVAIIGGFMLIACLGVLLL